MRSNSLKNHLEFVVLWYMLLEPELQLIWCQEKKGLCELENRKLILRLIFVIMTCSFTLLWLK